MLRSMNQGNLPPVAVSASFIFSLFFSLLTQKCDRVTHREGRRETGLSRAPPAPALASRARGIFPRYGGHFNGISQQRIRLRSSHRIRERKRGRGREGGRDIEFPRCLSLSPSLSVRPFQLPNRSTSAATSEERGSNSRAPRDTFFLPCCYNFHTR